MNWLPASKSITGTILVERQTVACVVTLNHVVRSTFFTHEGRLHTTIVSSAIQLVMMVNCLLFLQTAEARQTFAGIPLQSGVKKMVGYVIQLVQQRATSPASSFE